MATTAQTIFSDALSSTKNFVFLIKISLKFVPMGLVNNNPANLDNGLAPNSRRVIIWTNANPVHWHMCGTWGIWVNLRSVSPCSFTLSIFVRWEHSSHAQLHQIPVQSNIYALWFIMNYTITFRTCKFEYTVTLQFQSFFLSIFKVLILYPYIFLSYLD